MRVFIRTTLALLGLATAAGVFSSNALAQTPFELSHPQRARINARIKHQEQRIAMGVRQGRIAPPQAQALRREDHRIAQEERDMAAQNPGRHLRPDEVATLNQQLDANSGAISRFGV